MPESGPDAETRTETRTETDNEVPDEIGDVNDDDPADVELAVVTMRFDASDPEALYAVLSKYVVLTRMVPGCRNIDFCASVTNPARLLIVQKWDDIDAQRAHFDSELMVEMAQSCTGRLAAPPDIDLWDGVSAHDLH